MSQIDLSKFQTKKIDVSKFDLEEPSVFGQEAAEQRKQGFKEAVTGAASRFASGFREGTERGFETGADVRRDIEEEGLIQNVPRVFGTGFQTLGLGLVRGLEEAFAPQVEAVVQGAVEKVPDEVKQAVAPTLQAAAQKFEEFKQNFPEEDRATLEALIGIGSMILGGPVAKKGAGVISETAEQIAKKGEDLIGPTVAGFKETEAIQTLSKVPEKIQEIPGQIKEIPGKIKRKIIPEGKGREIAIRDMNELSEIKGKQLADFKRFSGDKTPGEFLVERGIVGKQDEIAQGLAKNFQTVKTALDDAVGQVRGNFSSPKLINALKQLQKETNEFSPELASITNRLARATQKDLVSGKPVGISLTEALETARQIERQAALFKAGNLPKAAQRMKDVKDALRQFIFEQAEAGGFTNITELSKEIQLHKNLLNAVGKRLDAKAFKPELDFTENMLLVAGTIEPSALAGLAVKKIARSERFKAARAKFLSPKAIKELPQPPTELINIRNREKMLDDLNSFLRRHGFTMKKERLDRMLPDSGVIQAKGPNVIAKEFQEDLQKFLLKEPTDPSIIPIELPAPSK